MTGQPATVFTTTSDLNKPRRGPNPKEERLYDQIVAAIIAKKLRPGERLNESELAKAQELSRTRVRRVLDRLEKEQVVRFELNRGAFISRPSVKEARETYEARAFIEEAVVRLLCSRAQPRVTSFMGDYLAREAEAYKQQKSGLASISSDFHILLAEAAGNSVLLGFIRSLVQRCIVINSLYEWPERDSCLIHEHTDIIEAIEAGDVEEAVLRMRHHMSHVAKSIKLQDSADDELDVYKRVGRS